MHKYLQRYIYATVGLIHSTYIDKVLKKIRMHDSKKGFGVMQHDVTLSKPQCPSTSDKLDRMSRVEYVSVVGSIMYVMICIRSDVVCALSMTSNYQDNLIENHCIAFKNILKYVWRTKNMFLVYVGLEELDVKRYTDASFQIDRDDSCLQSRFVFLLNGRVVTWSSFNQYTITDSTRQANYIVVNEDIKEVMYMKKLISDVHVVTSIDGHVKIFCDNEGAFALAK